MKQQPQNQALGASETTRFFCTRISPAAGAAGELCTGKRKEPDMAKRENEGKKEKKQKKERKEKRKQYRGLYLNPISVPRARTHARVVRPTGILKESLTDLPGARTRTRGERRFHCMARENVWRRFRSGLRGGRGCSC